MNEVGVYHLTPRQQEIMRALVEGDGTNRDIVRRVGGKESTVKTHLERIFATTGVVTRVQLAVWWVRMTEVNPVVVGYSDSANGLRDSFPPG